MAESRIYHGKCHCGAVSFNLNSEIISTGMRCNCSICRRRNAIMTSRYYKPEEFELLSGAEALSLYHFGDIMVNHYFCKHCGIYPFHDAIENPGTYRVNLGCIEAIDLEALELRLFDGMDTWTYLDHSTGQL